MEISSYEAFKNLYDGNTFPLFCDHSVLNTTVSNTNGSDINIRVCNGMELTNPEKGFNKGLPQDKLLNQDFQNALNEYHKFLFDAHGPLHAVMDKVSILYPDLQEMVIDAKSACNDALDRKSVV